MTAVDQAESRVATTELGFALCATAIYAAIVGVTTARHEIWQDEAQAWLIAKASAAPWDVLGNVRYEGHPMLWHLLLWPLTKITHDPVAMQMLAWVIAVAAAWLILRFAPFPRGVRVLLVFGYYTIFEYSVVARSYGLALLMVVITCVLASRPQRPFWWLALALALLAGSSAFGLILAAVLWGGILLDEILRNGRAAIRRLRWPTAALAVAGLGCAVQIVHQPASSSFATTVSAGHNRVLGGAVRAPLDAALPGLKDLVPGLYDRLQSGPYVVIVLLLLLAVCLMVVALAAEKPAALVTMVIGAAVLVLSMGYTGLLTYHHIGHLFLLALAVVWLQPTMQTWSGWAKNLRKRAPSDAALHRLANPLAVLLLVASVALGADFVVRDLVGPYVSWTAAADAIEQAGLENAVFVTDTSAKTSPVWALLDRKAFQVDAGSVGTYARWNLIKYRAPRVTETAIMAAAEALRTRGEPVVLVLESRLRDGHDVTLIGHFDRGIRRYSAWVYVLDGTR